MVGKTLRNSHAWAKFVALPVAALTTPYADRADKPKGERKVMIAQVAPAVRVAISECFGLAPGATTANQLAEALRRLGFDIVYGKQRPTAVPRPHTQQLVERTHGVV